MKCSQRGRNRTAAKELHRFKKREVTEYSQMGVGEMWETAIGFYNLEVVNDFREWVLQCHCGSRRLVLESHAIKGRLEIKRVKKIALSRWLIMKWIRKSK